jgi:hypothetical protein
MSRCEVLLTRLQPSSDSHRANMQSFCIVRHLQTIKDNYIKDRERYNKLVSTIAYRSKWQSSTVMQQ